MLYHYASSKVFKEEYPLSKPIKTSLIMPTLNEEDYIQSSLDSLLEQNIIKKYPDYFEIIVVDSYSNDNTVNIAKKYPVKILYSPKGLLTARTRAIKNSKGEIIISVNADTIYPKNFVNLYLKHFSDPEVVAVSSPRLSLPFNRLSLWYYLLFQKKPIMYGSNSAFRKKSFYEIGGFDLSINQFSGDELQPEEEVKFARRLSKAGKYIFDLQAPVFTSSRRLFASGKYLKELEKYERFDGKSVLLRV